eukprot:tig00001365_g8362.t1
MYANAAQINNAAQTHAERVPLHKCEPRVLSNVIGTNVLGTLYGARAALRAMAEQPSGGHVFNVVGRGSRGEGTPNSIAYGASKACIPSITKTLRQELRGTPRIGVHNVSPGMVMTELLAASALSAGTKARAHVVAACLAPRIRLQAGASGDLAYLTPLEVLSRFATFWLRRGRFYDAAGEPVPEAWGPAGVSAAAAAAKKAS